MAEAVMVNCIETQRLQWELKTKVNGGGDSSYTTSIVAAYFAYIVEENSLTQRYRNAIDGGSSISKFYFDDLTKFVPSVAQSFVAEVLRSVPSTAIEVCLGKNKETLLDFILNAEDTDLCKSECSTPASVIELALRILEIKQGETVVDNCSGVGTFIQKAHEMQPGAKYYGVEINSWLCGMTAIRMSLIGEKSIDILNRNVFDENFDFKFDKGFSAFPMGIRTKFLDDWPSIENYKETIPNLSRGTASDWLFSLRLLDSLKPTGKGITIMSPGGLWNTLDKEIRKYFVQSKRIESIILLPSKLLPNTNIPVAMVVWGQGREGIHFVDASNEYVDGRRQCELSSENINNIVKALSEQTLISRTASYDEIENKDFSFSVSHYLTQQHVPNGIKFSSVIRNITRGIQLSARELDDVVSKNPTDTQYLVPADIQNGKVSDNLTYLKSFDKRYSRYVVNNGNLLISKNGNFSKIAIANVKKGKIVVASGNLYIIELDTETVNPYYIKAFLESDMGQNEIKSIMVGTTIPSIGATQLGTIKIPLIPLSQQEEFVAKYLAAIDNVEYLKMRVEKAENEVTDVVESMFSGERC